MKFLANKHNIHIYNAAFSLKSSVKFVNDFDGFHRIPHLNRETIKGAVYCHQSVKISAGRWTQRHANLVLKTNQRAIGHVSLT